MQRQRDVGEHRPEVILDLNENDVLLGRGAPFVRYSGNMKFRRIIHERRPEYVATTRRHAKDTIAREIVKTIQGQNGRFLKKIESRALARQLGVPAGRAAWTHVEETVVLEKIKQTFRDSSSDPQSPGGGGVEHEAQDTVTGSTGALPADNFISAGGGKAAGGSSSVAQPGHQQPLGSAEAAIAAVTGPLLQQLSVVQTWLTLQLQQQNIGSPQIEAPQLHQHSQAPSDGQTTNNSIEHLLRQQIMRALQQNDAMILTSSTSRRSSETAMQRLLQQVPQAYLSLLPQVQNRPDVVFASDNLQLLLQAYSLAKSQGDNLGVTQVQQVLVQVLNSNRHNLNFQDLQLLMSSLQHYQVNEEQQRQQEQTHQLLSGSWANFGTAAFVGAPSSGIHAESRTNAYSAHQQQQSSLPPILVDALAAFLQASSAGGQGRESLTDSASDGFNGKAVSRQDNSSNTKSDESGDAPSTPRDEAGM
jgi:hypothetical protein